MSAEIVFKEPGPPSIGEAATSGVVWLLAQSVSARFLGFFSQLILAWLLTPKDFGTIGLAYTITGIAQTLVTFGVDDVLLQRQKTVRRWSSSAFWISLTLGTVGMLLMFAAAPVAAHFYQSTSLIGLIAVLAVAMPIRTLSTVPTVSIRLAMDFRYLAYYNTFETFVIQFGTILFAWIGCGAYSFALPMPIIAIIKAVLFWRKAPPLIWTRIKKVQILYMLGRSTTVFITRAIIEIVNQGDYIILGLIATKSVVGLYFFAFRFSVQPVRMLSGNFINVLLPAFAQMRSLPERQTDAALRACRLLAYLVVPFCFLQAALAAPGLRLLFGERWQGAIPIVQLLSVGLPFDAVSWITGSLLSARREFGRALRFAVVSAPLFFAAVITGAWYDGMIGVASGVVVYYMTYPPLCSVLILRGNGVATRQIMELYVVPVLIAGVAVGLSYEISFIPYIYSSNLLRVITTAAMSCIFYALGLHIFRRDVSIQIIGRSFGIFRRLKERLGPQAV